MPEFAADTFPRPVNSQILSAFEAMWDGLAVAGTWWTATERVAIVAATRRSLPLPLGETAPDIVGLSDAVGSDGLSPLTHEVVRRLVVDARRIWIALLVGVGGGIAQMLTFYRRSSVASGN